MPYQKLNNHADHAAFIVSPTSLSPAACSGPARARAFSPHKRNRVTLKTKTAHSLRPRGINVDIHAILAPASARYQLRYPRDINSGIRAISAPASARYQLRHPRNINSGIRAAKLPRGNSIAARPPISKAGRKPMRVSDRLLYHIIVSMK